MPVLLYSFLFLACIFFQIGREEKVFPVKHDNFTADNLGNVFFVRDAELLKYSSEGKMLGRYSNLKLGAITSVDATNPLKIMVYYKDYQQIIFLDNQLSPHNNSVSLQDLGLEQASLVCSGINNSFWVYDRRNNELVRFDQHSKKIASTGNLKQVLNEQIAPDLIKEQNNYLYLNCSGSGIYVFDIFGAFSIAQGSQAPRMSLIVSDGTWSRPEKALRV